MGMSRHTHRRAVSAHTLNAEGLSAATSTLFPTWLQKRWQPVSDPPGQETEILFSEECYHPMRTNLKILRLGGSPNNGPLKSLFCTDKVPVQSSQAPHMLSFPCVFNQEQTAKINKCLRKPSNTDIETEKKVPQNKQTLFTERKKTLKIN